MGLDMYLYKKTFVGTFGDEEQIKITGKRTEDIKPERISYIIENVGYWRKANQIHDWFDKNLETADGIENGADNYVSIDTLKQLLEVCKIVKEGSVMVKGKITNGYRGTKDGWEPILENGEYIQNPELAQKMLPTSDGFFFGSTDYDQYYMYEVEETIKIIEEILKEDPEGYGSYYYNADW